MKNKKLTQQDLYNSFLNELLSQHLFLPAKDVNQILIDKFNITSENSRKILSRAVLKNVIKSSKPFTFGNGQFIYYYNTYLLNIEDIKIIVEKSRPPVFRLLELLQLNGGVVSYYEALKITSSPNELSSTKVVLLDDIIKLLNRLDLAYEKRDDNNNSFIILKEFKQVLDSPQEKILMRHHYLKMITDCNLIPDIMSWLVNSNIIDNTSFIYRNKSNPGFGVIHNNLFWDAFGYTKSTGINKILGSKADSIEKQTLVVLDVVLASTYTSIHLDAFLDRIQININSVKSEKRKILPIIIFRDCNTEVFFTMRKNGIISFNISAIFGAKIYEILKRTSQLPLLLKDEENLDQLIESILKTINISGQDGALKDLRGTLFEYLMYPYLNFLYPKASFEQNRILKIGDRKHEFDYIITSSNPPEIVFVELKGLRDGTFISLGDNKTKATLKWFFLKSMSLAKDFYKNLNPSNLKFKAIFITTAGYWENTENFIEEMNNSSFRSVNSKTIIGRVELLENLQEKGFKNEARMIEKYYSKLDDDDEINYFNEYNEEVVENVNISKSDNSGEINRILDGLL